MQYKNLFLGAILFFGSGVILTSCTEEDPEISDKTEISSAEIKEKIEGCWNVKITSKDGFVTYDNPDAQLTVSVKEEVDGTFFLEGEYKNFIEGLDYTLTDDSYFDKSDSTVFIAVIESRFNVAYELRGKLAADGSIIGTESDSSVVEINPSVGSINFGEFVALKVPCVTTEEITLDGTWDVEISVDGMATYPEIEGRFEFEVKEEIEGILYPIGKYFDLIEGVDFDLTDDSNFDTRDSILFISIADEQFELFYEFRGKLESDGTIRGVDADSSIIEYNINGSVNFGNFVATRR